MTNISTPKLTPIKVVVSALLLLSLAAPISGLSWPLCDQGGTVWVTEKPKTDPTFPGADLWFFCEGSLNILGNAIDACVPNPNAANGSTCVPQVANAICQLLGYERAYDDDTEVVPAAPGEAVIALTGQYCIRQGQYASSLPKNLASIPGTPCNKIQKLTCVRTLNTMATAATLGLQQATSLSVLHPTPAAENLSATAQMAETLSKASAGLVPASEVSNVSSMTATGGRKLLTV